MAKFKRILLKLSGESLMAAIASGDDAAKQGHTALQCRRGVAERGDGNHRAAHRPNQRVHGIPDRIDPRNLVGDELDEIQDRRRADDPRIVEDLELIGQLDPAVA